jgi:hypothetical protein
MNRLAPRKCRVGEVWTYGRGLAYVVSVQHLDMAPQCDVLIADADGAVTSRRPDGQMRPIGIMERELIELVGTWSPVIANRSHHGQQAEEMRA